MKKRIVAVAISGIIIVIPVVLFVRVKIAERAWAQSLGDLESLPDRFHGEKNETTEMFSDWSSDLGLTSVVGGKASALDPGVADAIAAIAKYVSAVQTSDAAAPAAPPPVVWQYVTDHSAVLDDIGKWTATHPAPSWPMTFLEMKPVANFVTIMKLEKILIAAACVRDRDGDSRGAERLLLASWKINEGLRDRPELIAQLFAIAIFRMQCTAVRKIHVDPVAWQRRIEDHDYRSTVQRSFAVEAWLLGRRVKSNVYADPTYIAEMRAFNASIGGGAIGYVDRPRSIVLLTTPVRWFDLPALMEGWREIIVDAQRSPISDGGSENLDQAFERGFARWSFIPEPDMRPVKLSAALKRVDRVIAEAEFTEKVLFARAAREANGGRWPASIPGFASSRIEHGQWLYEPSGDRLTIRFSRELHWPNLLGDSIPLRVTLTSST